ncbi:ribosomal protection-like ABC-F family protein [Bacillus salitolerans]|uniref:Ribosomal protection-like ABC-F family protein n=1 Tax=Bacillus salitolerans TaxID=1437434 RepID=A0ABW4LM72_9BACI
MIICTVSDIKKIYGGTTIIESLSFDIQEGQRIGLVGPNGAGKTTILKLIAGEESLDGGAIHRKKRLKVGYLSQLPSYTADMTGRNVLELAFNHVIALEQKMQQLEVRMTDPTINEETLSEILAEYGQSQEEYTHIGGYEMESSLSAVASGLGIEPLLNQSFNLMSGGEKTKICIGLLLLQQPDLLLLDEPTNHLDVEAIEWLEDYLRRENVTAVVVSHDRYFLDQVVTHIYDLDEGEVTSYHLNYSSFVVEKEKRLMDQFAAFNEQQKRIKKMKDSIRRLRQWGNESGNEKFYRKAKSMEKALERIEKIKRPILERKKINLELEITNRSGNDVFIYENVTQIFNSIDLIHHFSFALRHKERVAIVGKNGTGKSTLIKMLTGEITPSIGSIQVGSNVKMGYLSQHIFEEEADQSVIDAFREQVPCLEGEARQILAKFLFYGASVFKKINQLSGGERMRLRLAQLMYQDINVLLLDEPTNHLDIDSKEVLEDALTDFEGAILCVSHDRYFLNKIFNQILWLENKEITHYIGTYDEAKLKRIKMIGSNDDAKLKKKDKSITSNKMSTMSHQIAGRSLDEIEYSIEQLEEKKLVIQREMMSVNDLDRLHDSQRHLEDIETQLVNLYNDLESLLDS